MRSILLQIILFAGFIVLGTAQPASNSNLPGLSADSAPHVWLDTLGTVRDYVYQHLLESAPKEYFEQQKMRRAVQRSACTNVTFDLAGGDGLSGLLQIVKMKIELALAVKHQSFEIQPNPEAAAFLKELGMKLEGIPLPDSTKFPADIWREE